MSDVLVLRDFPLRYAHLLPAGVRAEGSFGFRGKLRTWGARFAAFSTVVANKVLDHLVKTAYTTPAPLFMSLTTVAVTASMTGSTITEATYTGFARVSIATANWNAASAGSSTTNAVTTFGACTAGSSVVIGWALCSASSAGDVVMFGTCTSVTVNTVQTPPTVASGALTLTLT